MVDTGPLSGRQLNIVLTSALVATHTDTSAADPRSRHLSPPNIRVLLSGTGTRGAERTQEYVA
jgi:hypothetical protein